jgi:hypothetical protein
MFRRSKYAGLYIYIFGDKTPAQIVYKENFQRRRRVKNQACQNILR